MTIAVVSMFFAGGLPGRDVNAGGQAGGNDFFGQLLGGFAARSGHENDAGVH
jgi:hypothetical protein